MYLELDGEGPRYAQLLRALKSSVLAGRYAAGAKLPATRVLASDLGLSRNTVLAAYEQLRAEGFIEGRVGSGCYVAQIAAPVAIRSRPTRALPASALSRRGRRGLALYDRAIPGRQHKGLRYNLQYGLPLTNPALTSAWRRELNLAAAHAELDYPDPQGLLALRAAVCDYLARRRGINAAPEDVVIVSGSQQGFSLAAQVLLDEDDTVVLEDPNYQGARQVFQAFGARISGCRVDGDGLVPGALPTLPPKLLVVTPSHQFPTGAVLSLPRRMELLDYAAQKNCWIIEDDYDGEFRYDARPLAALKSLDRDDRVIYVGTFSKTLFPSLRIGYMLLPPGLRDAFIAAKWLDDRGCPAIEQAALARLIGSGAFERHLRQIAVELKQRRAILIAAIRRHIGDQLELADSSAGMHALAWLPQLDRVALQRLMQRASELGLGLYPVDPYYLRRPARCGLLLGYADLPPADLEAAMVLLGRCLGEVRSLHYEPNDTISA
jgi:GntR family transcriptional regulator/MocR family aminotransferase